MQNTVCRTSDYREKEMIKTLLYSLYYSFEKRYYFEIITNEVHIYSHVILLLVKVQQ